MPRIQIQIPVRAAALHLSCGLWSVVPLFALLLTQTLDMSKLTLITITLARCCGGAGSLSALRCCASSGLLFVFVPKAESDATVGAWVVAPSRRFKSAPHVDVLINLSQGALLPEGDALHSGGGGTDGRAASSAPCRCASSGCPSARRRRHNIIG